MNDRGYPKYLLAEKPVPVPLYILHINWHRIEPVSPWSEASCMEKGIGNCHLGTNSVLHEWAMTAGKKTEFTGNRLFYISSSEILVWIERKCLFTYLFIYFVVLLLNQNIWRRIRECLMNNGVVKHEKWKWPWPISLYCREFCSKVVEKTAKYLGNFICLNRDSTRVTPKYKMR
jgi:hypothetical protein